MEGNKSNIKHSIKAELAANQWVCAAPDMTGSWPLRNKETSNNTDIIYWLSQAVRKVMGSYL